MDPLFTALSLFRRREFQRSEQICTEQLARNPYDQAFWTLKMRCLSEQTFSDDLEADEEGIAELLLDESAIATVARPGTSLKTAAAARPITQATRPVTQSGRPVTGVLRPGTQGPNQSLESSLRTPRTAKTARPLTSSSGRFVRMGTASMLSQPDGPFINLARLNIAKYAANHLINKPLWEYIYYHENDYRAALDLAAKATEASSFGDWWWKVALGRAYYGLGMVREAEKQFRSATGHRECAAIGFLWLGKVYCRLDQPLAALDAYKNGADRYPGETTLISACARVQEGLNDLDGAVVLYKDVLHYEAINIEAIACIALHHFYNDQPEVALRYYRRLLQMGTWNAEIYNNLALCCYYSQQLDMCVACFERALLFADSDEVTADIWYNMSHVAIGAGDRQLALQCLRLALVSNNEHPEAYNNLGVLEMTKPGSATVSGSSLSSSAVSPGASQVCLPLRPVVSPGEQGSASGGPDGETKHRLTSASGQASSYNRARAYYQAASRAGPHLYEPAYNEALLAEKLGHYDQALRSLKRALQLYPGLNAAKEKLKVIQKLYQCP